MKTIGERIRHYRKEIKNATQKEFGLKIGLKPNSVSDIESGKNNPTEQTIKAICREFNVSENWLRNGIEPMMSNANNSRNQEIQAFTTDVMEDVDDSFRKRFIGALSKLDERDWEALAKIVEELQKED